MEVNGQVQRTRDFPLTFDDGNAFILRNFLFKLLKTINNVQTVSMFLVRRRRLKHLDLQMCFINLF
jgi:hypothetical protein